MKAVSAQSRPDEYAKGGDMKLTIAGTPDTIAARVQQLADMGINHLHLRFMGEIDGETRHICKTSAELFAKEVMPRFAKRVPHRSPLWRQRSEEGDTLHEENQDRHEGRKSRSRSLAVDRRENQALSDWRGETLARVRALIKQVDPGVVEEVKWRKPSNPMGVPVWEHDGILCTGETYKAVVKLTFAQGASLKDPSRIFNSSLEGNVRRAIDIHEGEKINEKALKALIQAAVALNTSKRAAARPARSQKKPKSA